MQWNEDTPTPQTDSQAEDDERGLDSAIWRIVEQVFIQAE